MRIDEITNIIVEVSPEDQAKLNNLRALGKTELAHRISVYLGKINDWDAAAEAARDDMEAGKPMPNSQGRVNTQTPKKQAPAPKANKSAKEKPKFTSVDNVQKDLKGLAGWVQKKLKSGTGLADKYTKVSKK